MQRIDLIRRCRLTFPILGASLMLSSGCAIHSIDANGRETIVGFPVIVHSTPKGDGQQRVGSDVRVVGVLLHRSPADTAVSVGYARSTLETIPLEDFESFATTTTQPDAP